MRISFLALMIVIIFSIDMASVAFADDLKKAGAIASKGCLFQAERIKVAAENLANKDTAAISPEAEPYTRKVVIAKNKYDRNLKTNVLVVDKVAKDKNPPKMVYNPRHPGANARGMVKYPNIEELIEKADAGEAERSYEANLSITEITNSLINKTIEAMR